MRLAARLRDRRRDERGAVVVLVAAMTVVLFGIAALVADLGQARVLRSEAQAASDSSALAAANRLYLAGTPDADLPAAIAAAHDYALDNYGVTEADWAACQDPGALANTAPPTMYGAKTYVATECISYDDDDATRRASSRRASGWWPRSRASNSSSAPCSAPRSSRSRRRRRRRSSSTRSPTVRCAWSASGRTTYRTVTPRSPAAVSRSTATCR